MATKTLRPASDSSVSHSRSSGNQAYLLLSESSADGDSTYISQSISGTSSASVSSTVVMGSIFDSINYNVTACRLYFSARRTASNTSSASVTFKVNNSGNYTVSANSLSDSYTVYNSSNTDLVNAINQALNSGSVPSVSATITTKGNKSSSKDSNSEIRVTQVYLEIDYESASRPTTAIFIKENGTWKQYGQVYKKVNGVWVEQQNLSSLFSTNTNYVKG